MTIFVDASALVAIIAGEPERLTLLDVMIANDAEPIWSAMSCWETVSALRSSGKLPVGTARMRVEELASELGLALVPIGDPELKLALDAYQTYGKGSGHRAQLNMGDCFAYACTKTNGARLLYKGNDFAHTDLA